MNLTIVGGQPKTPIVAVSKVEGKTKPFHNLELPQNTCNGVKKRSRLDTERLKEVQSIVYNPRRTGLNLVDLI